MPEAPVVNERVLLSMQPSPAYVLLWAPWTWILSVVVVVVGAWLALHAHGASTFIAGVGLLALSLACAAIVTLCRRYVLTESRACAYTGVFRRIAREAPLEKLQHAVLIRSFFERLVGAGTIALPTAGTDTYAMVWRTIPRPASAMDALRKAMDAARCRREPAAGLVLGLTGGIGAGKSEVARLLGGLGYLIIDSDRDAKAALDRPDVRDALVEWWGSEILDPEGRVRRPEVARIIFSDPGQRRRLEELVHPIVKADRATLIARVRTEGRPGVVIDAPLLFEAGSDKECDYVIYVDAPREQRLERIRSTRGWDESELARRENAQISLEEKRRRSDLVIINDADAKILQSRVREALARLSGIACRTSNQR